MKKATISKLRVLLKNKNWVQKRLNNLYQQAIKWNEFEHFECSSFFRGEIVARKNRKKFNQAMNRIERQIEFLEKQL